jgi:prolyl-tRNA synthetase
MGKCSALGNENEIVFKNCRILWQEGHTHATKAEAVEVRKMMNVYADFAENFMNSSNKRIKTETERFAGAEETYCIEALMQDGKSYKLVRHTFRSEFCKALM